MCDFVELIAVYIHLNCFRLFAESHNYCKNILYLYTRWKQNCLFKYSLTQILTHLHKYCQPEGNFHQVKTSVRAQCCKVTSCRSILSSSQFVTNTYSQSFFSLNHLSASNLKLLLFHKFSSISLRSYKRS